MALYGSFSSMSLPDLLQWVSNGGKTGTLEVEHNKVVKRVVFREGRVIACSSDEPSELLGHYLVSLGKMNEETLRKALAKLEASRKHLGEIVVEMGVISREELARHLTAKAEETIFSLFDWEDAVFRFFDSLLPRQPIFPVNLRVEEILLQGMQRYDEMKRIRAVFNDPGIVLRRAAKPPPADISRSRMARRIYDLINGERTVAEILLHAHASEYLVTKFLFELFRTGIVEIEGVVPVPSATAQRVPALGGPLGAPSVGKWQADALGPGAPEDSLAQMDPRTGASAAVADPPAGSEVPSARTPSVAATETSLNLARRTMEQGDYDAAIEILNEAYRAEPNHDSLRRLLTEAEAAFVEKAYRHFLPASKVPFLIRRAEDLTNERITPNEFFLLSRIDGTWDVKSIIQISPLREVDALRAMKRMRDRGFIDLRDPD